MTNHPCDRGCQLELADCYGRTVPALCRLIAAGRTDYERLVRDRSGPAAGEPARIVATADGRVRAGIVGPIDECGGIRTWIEALVRSVDPAWVQWVAVANQHDRANDAGTTLDGVPVWYGDSACRCVADSVDVLLLWCWRDVRSLVPARSCRPAVIRTSHAAGVTAQERLAVELPAGVDIAVAVSHAALGSYPVPQRASVRVIPNGVPIDRVRPTEPAASVRAGWGFEPDHRILLQLARLSPEKRPWALIDTIAELHRRGRTEWRGVLVGDGLYRDELFGRAERLGLSGMVALPGSRSDVGSVLHATDAMLLPSETEACAFALIEAWLAGVPVVATPVGLVREIPALVRLLPQPPREADLADAIETDWHDPIGVVQREARTLKALAVARERFTSTAFGKAWTDLILEAAAIRRTRSLGATA